MVTEQFVALAKQVGAGFKYSNIPTVVLPHPFEILKPEEIKRIAEEKVGELMATIAKEH